MRKRTTRVVDDMVLVRFKPQAWIRDNATEVDAAGPTTFRVPVADAQDGNGNWLRDHSDASDFLRVHKNAPRWIQRWSGPFEIEIEYPGKEA